MIYRGFLEVVWFGSSPIPFPSVSCLSFLVFQCVADLTYGIGGEGGGRGAESYNREKAWHSVNQSILSEIPYHPPPPHSPPDRRKTVELTSQTGVCLFTPPANDANYGKSAKSRNYFQLSYSSSAANRKRARKEMNDTTNDGFLLYNYMYIGHTSP